MGLGIRLLCEVTRRDPLTCEGAPNNTISKNSALLFARQLASALPAEVAAILEKGGPDFRVREPRHLAGAGGLLRAQ